MGMQAVCLNTPPGSRSILYLPSFTHIINSKQIGQDVGYWNYRLAERDQIPLHPLPLPVHSRIGHIVM